TRVKPGEVVDVKAFLRQYRGGEAAIALQVRIPPGAPPGNLDLVVGDAAALARFEARSQRYAPHSLGQVIELINSLRKGSSVYALLTRPDAGVAVKGFKLTGL